MSSSSIPNLFIQETELLDLMFPRDDGEGTLLPDLSGTETTARQTFRGILHDGMKAKTLPLPVEYVPGKAQLALADKVIKAFVRSGDFDSIEYLGVVTDKIKEYIKKFDAGPGPGGREDAELFRLFGDQIHGPERIFDRRYRKADIAKFVFDGGSVENWLKKSKIDITRLGEELKDWLPKAIATVKRRGGPQPNKHSPVNQAVEKIIEIQNASPHKTVRDIMFRTTIIKIFNGQATPEDITKAAGPKDISVWERITRKNFHSVEKRVSKAKKLANQPA